MGGKAVGNGPPCSRPARLLSLYVGDETMEQPWRNVFDWLDDIRQKPSMYLRHSSLTELNSLIWGYYVALRVHSIVESVPSMNRHFLFWLYYRTSWSMSGGWDTAINERYPNREEALAIFFKWAYEYRQLNPMTLCTVRLAAKHNPTGKRIRYGLDGLMEKPRQVDVVRYRPAPLHFLRFHYRDRVENGDLLMTATGDYATTVRFAKQWVHDELQVESAAWRRVPASSRSISSAR
jgi:hypothetical protein